ncbi:CPBP family intramembrane glutamic endopeptidase [Curtobacterium sp. MCPF17_047]|uniref:CPBP family intramembrane glutamic endopeptidase n=1 Tax=Curtobacterium sp. MCPF17_047 TaxID=2175654 RepID=UPI001C646C34|nr:CPBP family intramembrane glutamic endopeptidase [Curtobacterium sp. MCPF17_047]
MINRLRTFPVTWMIIGTVLVVLTSAVFTAIGAESGPIGMALMALIGMAAGSAFYVLTMRVIARRRIPELALRTASREALTGLGIGAAFVIVSYGIVLVAGGYSIDWAPRDVGKTLMLAIAVNASAAVIEELTFRGLLFQGIERLGGRERGRWIALTVTAALFGALHIMNPGATLWTSLAIAVEAGVLLGAAFLWRRSLWFVIGIHFAWNVIEGLLGIPVSGHRDAGLFITTVHGDGLLTGGTFGLEASLVPVIVSLAIAVPMLTAAARQRPTEMDDQTAPPTRSRS